MAAHLMSRLRRALPVFGWLPGYGRPAFASDLAAGLTVGAVLIPQGMAYALVAGLPPVVGLYAAVFPIVAYAARGVEFCLANVKRIILDVMRRSGFYVRLGPARFFFSTHEAVGYAQNLLQDREITLEPEPPVVRAILRMPAGAALDV